MDFDDFVNKNYIKKQKNIRFEKVIKIPNDDFKIN
jgi:hypothetical protein